MKTQRKIFTLLFIVLFISCRSIIKQPDDDDKRMYFLGRGEGKSIREAETNARLDVENQISSYIFTVVDSTSTLIINSNITNNKIVNNNENFSVYLKSYTHTILEGVKRVKTRNYKSSKDNFEVESLFVVFRANIDKVSAYIKNDIEGLSRNYTFQINQQDTSELETIHKYLGIISALNPFERLQVNYYSQTGAVNLHSYLTTQIELLRNKVNNKGIPLPVPAPTIVEQFTWLKNNAESNGYYLIEVNNNTSISPQNVSIPSGRNNVTIIILGKDVPRNITISDYGSLFTINSGITLILDTNIILQGKNNNDRNLVNINNGGTLIMNSESGITGCIGGVVHVYKGGTFTMYGGAIFDNKGKNGANGYYKARNGYYSIGDDGQNGESVGIYNEGIFTLHGGTISNNSGGNGGNGGHGGDGNNGRENGIFANEGGPSGISGSGGFGGVYNSGTFNMYGGTISGNTGGNGGNGGRGGNGGNGSKNGGNGGHGGSGSTGGIGGVYNIGTFNMYGGTISGNTGGNGGNGGKGGLGGKSGRNIGKDGSNGSIGSGGNGGVFNSGTFIMRGGIIASNTGGYGGYSTYNNDRGYDSWGAVSNFGSFRISNGIIYGNDLSTYLKNSHGAFSNAVNATAQRGIFNVQDLFISLGTINSTYSTIYVVNGLLQ